MSKLQELIDRLCPDGVLFEKLGDYIDIYTGEQFNKRDMMSNGTYPVINGGTTASGYVEKYNEPQDTITISQGGASAGYVSWQSQKFWAGAHCYVVRPKGLHLCNKFVFYFLKNSEIKLYQMKHGAGIPALNRDKVQNLTIPIPPIEVQEEIVRILDNFSEYAAELQAELQGRKEQYEYYRNLLLTFNPSACGYGTDGEQKIGDSIETNEVRYIKIGSLGTFENIGVDKKTVSGEEHVLLLNYVDVYKNRYLNKNTPTMEVSASDRKILDCSIKQWDIFITPSSETRDDIGHSAVVTEDIPGAVYSYHIMRFRLHKPDRITACYINYLFESFCVQKQILKFATGQTRFGLSKYKFAEIIIPLPPIEIQEKIVSILDRFETLVNDLSEGLPAEIAAVKEQYEYYRDKLLTFKPLDKEDE